MTYPHNLRSAIYIPIRLKLVAYVAMGAQVAVCFGRYDRERNDRGGRLLAVGVFLAEDCLILLILYD